MRDSPRKVAGPGRLLRRSVVFAGIASLLLCSQGKASTITILAYSQNQGGAPITLTNLGNGTETITGTENVSLGTLEGTPQGLTPPLAVLTISATSVPGTTTPTTAPPVGTPISEQFTGTFTITAGAINYLSGTFTDIFSGKEGGLSASLVVSNPPDSLTFTSSGIPPGTPGLPAGGSLSTGLPRGMSISFTNLSSPLTIVNGSIGVLGATSMASSGVFSASTVSVIPEPSTFLIAGIGGLGLIGYGLRRRRVLGA